MQVQSLSKEELETRFDKVCRGISMINAGSRISSKEQMQMREMRREFSELKEELESRGIEYSTSGYLL